MSHCRGKFLTASQDSAQAPVCKSICAKNAEDEEPLHRSSKPNGAQSLKTISMLKKRISTEHRSRRWSQALKPSCASNIPIDGQNALSRANIPPPPANIKNNFCWRCSEWMSFDVETHNLAPPSEHDWKDGEFGHLRRVVDVDLVCALYIVPLGWTIGGGVRASGKSASHS